jgi:phage tail tube protein FII
MKELTKKCIGLISNTFVQLGQTKSDKDILILASTLAEDLIRDFPSLSFKDVEEAFRSGIRGDRFAVNVQTYYHWLRAQKKLIDEDVWKQNNQSTYRTDKRLIYRNNKGTGTKIIGCQLTGVVNPKTINKLIK